MSSLTARIKEQARRLGFQLAGVTTPDPPPHLQVFESWLAAGLHGEMAYLAAGPARQKRADPRLVLPECRSILVLGMRYPSPGAVFAGQAMPGRGRVASYAWGDDYHDLLPPRLKALVAFIEQQVGRPVPNRWYTDTGPVLERDLAQRAGLGWIGKNGCLIQPRQGSYYLLSEILLGLDLTPDPPFLPDLCGSCTRCLDACPTGCILPNRTLDARRCISYLTIELKGPIPAGLRPQVGEWVFGCDVCQEVCPWNRRFADPRGEAGRQAVEVFAPRPALPHPLLSEELALTPEQFNRKFKGSPVMRAKRRGYLRNVAVALGNAHTGRPDPAATAALRRALMHDPEPLVRAHAAWALGRLTGPDALRALQEAQPGETDPGVLAEVRSALAGLGNTTTN